MVHVLFASSTDTSRQGRYLHVNNLMCTAPLPFKCTEKKNTISVCFWISNCPINILLKIVNFRTNILVFLFIHTIHNVFLFIQVHITVGLYRKATWCIKEWKSEAYGVLYEVYMFVIILAFPASIMTFAYVKICQELWFMSNARSMLRSES